MNDHGVRGTRGQVDRAPRDLFRGGTGGSQRAGTAAAETAAIGENRGRPARPDPGRGTQETTRDKRPTPLHLPTGLADGFGQEKPWHLRAFTPDVVGPRLPDEASGIRRTGCFRMDPPVRWIVVVKPGRMLPEAT